MKTIGKLLLLSEIAGTVAYFISKRHYASELKEEEKKSTSGSSDEKLKYVSEVDDETQKMFKNLEMTKEQKEKYQADYQALNNTWLEENPDMVFDDMKRREQQEKTMKAVLNESQYAIYRERFEEQN